MLVVPADDVDPRALVTVGVQRHGIKYEAEEGGREYAVLLHPTGHCQCLRDSAVVRDARHHPVVEPTRHVSELFRTAEFLYDPSQSLAIHHVEDFRQVHEYNVELGQHLLALLLRLAFDGDHVGGSVMSPEVTLTFQEKSLFKIPIETIEADAGEDLVRMQYEAQDCILHIVAY
ncbi:Peptidyl-prolyl isomerase cwc27 [Sparganum proliferum]